jgi:hypothetical protein
MSELELPPKPTAPHEPINTRPPLNLPHMLNQVDGIRKFLNDERLKKEKAK